MSPRFVIKTKKSPLYGGGYVCKAAVLQFHGHKPLVMDLRSIKPGDNDHVVAVFKQFGRFGALSKTNHGVLRYREPIYATVRELAMSYFHEYFLNSGKKTLREYSGLFNLSRFENLDWRTSGENLFKIPQILDKIKHYKILNSVQIKNLRKADSIEIAAGRIVEWKK